MKIKAEFKASSIVLIILITIFVISVVYLLGYNDSTHPFVLAEFINWLVISVILGVIFSFIFQIFNRRMYLAIEQNDIVYHSTTINKRMNINDIVSIGSGVNYSFRPWNFNNKTYIPQMVIKSEVDQITFIHQNFKNSELTKLLEELKIKNSRIVFDDSVKTFMSGKNTRKYYYKTLLSSPRALINLGLTAILTIFLIVWFINRFR